MKPLSFKRHRFPADVIVHAVWLYFRNYPRPCRGLNQAVTTPRMVWNLLAPGLRRAVSVTVRISASPWAAHMAR